MSEDELARFLDWRGVEIPCATCGGSGRRTYGSTATWRGGIGGARMTADVCDACWGTGDAGQRGVDLRALRAGEEARVAERAACLLAHSVGAGMGTTREAIREIASELERLARGRKLRPRWFPNLCESLAKTLRRAAGDGSAVL